MHDAIRAVFVVLVSFLFVPFTSVHAAGEVAAYSFDEGSGTTLTDLVGSNTGTLVNGPVWTTTGQFGGALVFDGSNDYVDIGNFDITGGAMTMSAWVKFSSLPTNIDQRIISKANDSSAGGHYWMLSHAVVGPTQHVLRFRLKTNGVTDTLYASSGNLATNTWYHAAAVYNGSTMKLYLNGVEVGSMAKSGNIDTNPSVGVNLGRNPGGSANPLAGTMDNVRIYNRALTQAEIQQDMQTPVAPPAPDTTPPSISLTAPADGATVSGTINIAVDASDNIGVAGIQFYLDGAAFGPEDTSSPYETAWDTTGADGPHTLFAIAHDAAGNQATSSAVAVTVITPAPDTTPPSVPMNLLAAPVSPTQISLSWDDSIDDVGVAGYNVYHCQGSACTPTALIATVVTPDYQHGGLVPGSTHTYAVDAFDAASNTSAASETATATTQDPPPGSFDFTKVVLDDTIGGDVKMVADIDLDGFKDVIVGGYANEELRWHRYPTWDKYTIASIGAQFTTDAAAGDIDGDGDIDIVAPDDGGAFNLSWYENPKAGGGDPTVTSEWTRHVIGIGNGLIKDVELADFDSNGLMDIATRIGTQAQLWTQTAPDTWSMSGYNISGGEGMGSGDIDLDGDTDLVLEGFWLRNPGGASAQDLSLWEQFTIGAAPAEFKTFVANIDGDPAMEVLYSNSELQSADVVWWDPITGDPTGSWTSHTIATAIVGAHTLQAGDMDLDGDTDVVVGQMHTTTEKELAIYLNQDGLGISWQKFLVDQGTGIHNGVVADIGSDGDLDIFGANWAGNPPVALWENNLLNGSSGLPIDQWTYKQVTGSHEQTFGLAFGDVNGDGNEDIVSGGYWYRNPGGDMLGTWIQFALPAGMHAILTTDVDGDSFADVIAQKTEGNLSIYWLEATDAAGTSWNSVFAGSVPVASHGLGAQGYHTADVVLGGRPEVLVSSGGGVYYFEIPAASPEAGNWSVVRVNPNPSDEGFDTGDIDGDGDVDVAGTTGSSKLVQWYRNPGNGTPDWSAFTLGSFPEADYPDRTEVADFNGDGRLDVAVSEENGGASDAQTYWWAAPLDSTTGGWVRTLVTTQGTTNSMDSADMDNDGDNDLVLGEHRGTQKVAIWQNDGSGVFTETVVDAGKESHLGVRTVDLDQDGDLDIVSIAYDTPQNIHLWRNDALVSGGMPIDTTAPAAATDLVVGNPTSNSLEVSWSAPGDDGAAGTATSYDLRYSTTPIDDTNWDSATEVAGEPTPSVAGSAESMTISGLAASTAYYVALKTSDEVPNISLLSNVASGATLEDPSVLITALEDLQTQHPDYTAQIQALIDELSGL